MNVCRGVIIARIARRRTRESRIISPSGERVEGGSEEASRDEGEEDGQREWSCPDGDQARARVAAVALAQVETLGRLVETRVAEHALALLGLLGRSLVRTEAEHHLHVADFVDEFAAAGEVSSLAGNGGRLVCLAVVVALDAFQACSEANLRHEQQPVEGEQAQRLHSSTSEDHHE